MPFNMLVTTCLSDRTVFKEQEIKVYVNRKRGEKVLFFVIDDQSNKRSDFQEVIYNIKSGQNKKICDLLIYFSDINTTNDIFCFVELKTVYSPDDIEKAAEQLISAKQGLISKLNIKSCNHKYKPVTCIAYICYQLKMSSLIDLKGSVDTSKNLLKTKFQYVDIGNKRDMGEFIRKYKEK